MDKQQITELKEKLQGETHYNIIYVDFANPKHILVNHDINMYSSLDLEHFLRFYVFNDTFMRVYTKRGPRHFTFHEIKKEDFDEGSLEKAFYVDYSEYQTLYMRVGKINGISTLQYLRFEK